MLTLCGRKAIVAPIAGIGFLIWFVVKAGGAGPILHQPSTVHGSQKAWQFVIACELPPLTDWKPSPAVTDEHWQSRPACPTWLRSSPSLSSSASRRRRSADPPRSAQDFASRANKVSSAMLPQLFALPICFALVSFVGIVISSSSTVIYGESIWNPLDLLERVLDESPTHGERAGVAFIALSFIIAQLGTNVAANTLSASVWTLLWR